MTYRLRIMREELGSADERHKLARKRPRTPHALDEVRLRKLERADHRGGACGTALRPVLPQQPNELCRSATVCTTCSGDVRVYHMLGRRARVASF